MKNRDRRNVKLLTIAGQNLGKENATLKKMLFERNEVIDKITDLLRKTDRFELLDRP